MSHYKLKDDFSILSRGEIIHFIIEKLRQDRFRELACLSKIVFTQDIAEALSKHSMSQSEFIEIAADADFFICPPGFRMPHCHNMIEIMCAGSIPITNYHKYMSPPLRHRVDCLAFDTLEELEACLEHVMTISVVELERLRHGVMYYYNNYLEPFAAGNRIMKRIDAISKIAVNDESGL